uniref:Uncharacterized protein n=1 Tax=Felis catus TaxID=9685 RepID=A0ABI7XW29_FELCA
GGQGAEAGVAQGAGAESPAGKDDGFGDLKQKFWNTCKSGLRSRLFVQSSALFLFTGKQLSLDSSFLWATLLPLPFQNNGEGTRTSAFTSLGIKQAKRGTWVAQSGKCPPRDFSSGHDLMVREFKPHMERSAVSTEPSWYSVSPLSLLLPPLTLAPPPSKIE